MRVRVSVQTGVGVGEVSNTHRENLGSIRGPRETVGVALEQTLQGTHPEFEKVPVSTFPGTSPVSSPGFVGTRAI